MAFDWKLLKMRRRLKACVVLSPFFFIWGFLIGFQKGSLKGTPMYWKRALKLSIRRNPYKATNQKASSDSRAKRAGALKKALGKVRVQPFEGRLVQKIPNGPGRNQYGSFSLTLVPKSRQLQYASFIKLLNIGKGLQEYGRYPLRQAWTRP